MNEIHYTSGDAQPPVPAPAQPAYLERYRAFNDMHVCDKVEALLSAGQKDCRQARRKFKRIVEKNWPLNPDPVRHPRTAIFVERYNIATAETAGKAQT